MRKVRQHNGKPIFNMKNGVIIITSVIITEIFKISVDKTVSHENVTVQKQKSFFGFRIGKCPLAKRKTYFQYEKRSFYSNFRYHIGAIQNSVNKTEPHKNDRVHKRIYIFFGPLFENVR